MPVRAASERAAGTALKTSNLVKSSLKEVKRFVSDDGVDFVVDNNKKLITAIFVIVGEVDVQHLYYSPTITVSDKATISPASGMKQDFNNPVQYTVTAEDGSQAIYTAEVATYNFSGTDTIKQFPSTSGAVIPQEAPSIYLVSSMTGLLADTWDFAYSGTLEVRQVGGDQVLTLLEQTPTTQTITVKVNDDERAPTQSSGQFGWSLTLNADKTYTGISELGDSGSGAWDVVDLGKAALNRYELKLDGVAIIAGGPSVSAITKYYITGVTRSALHLTHDPLITSKSTTTFDSTLTRRQRVVSYQFSVPKPGAPALTFSWSWGKPPFHVQFKESLSGAWSEVAATNDRSYTASLQGATGFYRIVGSGGN